MPENEFALNVLDLLESQHAEVDHLIEELENDADDRAAIFAELADKLAAHAMVEEKIFYPAVMQKNTSDLLHESVEEHLSIKRVLADLLQLDPDEDRDLFDAGITVLKEQVSHHAHDEEEGKLFPILRESLSEDELAALGNEVLEMFESVIAEEPRRHVPEETEAPAPLPG